MIPIRAREAFVLLVEAFMHSIGGVLLMTFLFAWLVIALVVSEIEELDLAELHSERAAATAPACDCPCAEQNR